MSHQFGHKRLLSRLNGSHMFDQAWFQNRATDSPLSFDLNKESNYLKRVHPFRRSPGNPLMA